MMESLRDRPVRSLPLLVIVAAVACADCRLLSDPDATTIKSLIVAGTPPAIGAVSQFTAVAVRQDGTSDVVTAQAAWRSSNTAIATVSGDGIVAATSRGSVEISATYGGAKGAFSFAIQSNSTFTLSGTITDATTRLAIANATIVARDASGASRTGTTNGAGRYSIPDLSSGALDLTVRADGYTTALQSARLTADLTLDVALARASNCSAIGFDGLAASDTFAGYAACGFTVNATTPNWSVSTDTGRPPPFVHFTSRALSSTAGELLVTAGARFKFQSVDLYSSTTPVLYTIIGITGSTAAFTQQNSLSTTGDFATITNAQTALAIDALVIRLTTPATACCASVIGIDNVVLVH